jgi:hypothetical protein
VSGPKAFADLGDLPEDERIEIIGRVARGTVTGFIVDDEAMRRIDTDLAKALASPIPVRGSTTAEQVEPMNLRLFHDERGHWFIRGFGYSGNGATPEDAIRDLAMHINCHEAEKWPVRGSSGRASGLRRPSRSSEHEPNCDHEGRAVSSRQFGPTRT